ncbi:transposase [Micromonospora sp. CA-244673]|uniref:transposase n=1 Tax=Micromonospora sp. CA-244673 TaxID=3239958 RepID=UPI003D945763
MIMLSVGYNFISCSPDDSAPIRHDVRGWLPPQHLCWHILKVVGELDLSGLLRGHRADGQGAAAYPPQVLLSLVLYCYCKGVRSTRKIEAACLNDVGCRIITGNQQVDHATVARFLRRHREGLNALFVQVLALCARCGLWCCPPWRWTVINECDAKLERYRAALDAGANPAVVTGRIVQTQTERARAEADLDANAGNRPRRMSRAEITALVTALGDIAAALRDADPADKAEVYRQLGLRLTYQPETQTVRASVDLSAHRGVMVCVRGATRTIAPPPMTIGKTLRLTLA